MSKERFANYKEIKEYEKELTTVLNKDNVTDLLNFFEKHGKYFPYEKPTNPLVYEIALRKMQLHKKGVYPKLKRQAINWLLSHGYSLSMDRTGR